MYSQGKHMTNQSLSIELKNLVDEIKEEEQAAIEHGNKEMLSGLQIARVKVEMLMESIGINRSRTVDAEVIIEPKTSLIDLDIEQKFHLNIAIDAFSQHLFIIQDLLDSTIARMIEIGEELMSDNTCPHIELLTYTEKPDNWQSEPVGIEFTANAYAALRMLESYEIRISDVLEMSMETLTSMGSKLR
jgi:hypothetical protein